MAYIPHTTQDVDRMLKTIGVADVEALFSDIPAAARLAKAPGPDALSEYETLRLLGARARQNKAAGSDYLNFMGAGSYEHYIPSAVQAIAQRGEILTAYTPYQAEASQGTLQIIFEFQSMICALTGMEVANASMYDGASALGEAALMAVRINNRHQIVVAGTVHPNYRAVVDSYTRHLGVELIEWPAKDGLIDPATWPAAATEPCALIVAQPNFFGSLEDAAALAEQAHKRGAVVIASVNPMSLSVIEPPGEWGAEIVTGEAQPLGLPMGFGGPYVGFLSTKEAHIRKMPGRIVGRTEDHDGRPGFTLTLQTREQHIRRERATSNICTNQGLCATMSTIHMAMIGKTGFIKLGELNLEMAGRLREGLTALPGVKALNDAPIFNEFAVRLPIPAEAFEKQMRGRGIIPGLAASRLGVADANLLIVCATETKNVNDLNLYLTNARAILENRS